MLFDITAGLPGNRISVKLPMRTTWNFFTAGQLHFGTAGVKQIGVLAGRFGVERVFIVTDPALVEAGLLDRVKQPLDEAGLSTETFDGGEPEPSIDAANPGRGVGPGVRPRLAYWASAAAATWTSRSSSRRPSPMAAPRAITSAGTVSLAQFAR